MGATLEPPGEREVCASDRSQSGSAGSRAGACPRRLERAASVGRWKISDGCNGEFPLRWRMEGVGAARRCARLIYNTKGNCGIISVKSVSRRTPARPATPTPYPMVRRPGSMSFGSSNRSHRIMQPLSRHPREFGSPDEESRSALTKRICPISTILAAAQGIVAIWNVFPAENAGHTGVNGQTQPLAGLVCRTLHRDARQVRHGRGVVN